VRAFQHGNSTATTNLLHQTVPPALRALSKFARQPRSDIVRTKESPITEEGGKAHSVRHPPLFSITMVTLHSALAGDTYIIAQLQGVSFP